MEMERKMEKAEDLYNVVKHILSKYKKPYQREQIKTEIENEIKTYPYIRCILSYLGIALENGDNDAKDAFYNIFYEDLKNHNLYTFCWVVMNVEGLFDIPCLDYMTVMLDWQRSPGWPTTPAPELIYPIKRVNEIYSHSQHDQPLLIVGETGTSKELVARVIHKLSNRRDGPFMETNCAAIPENLVESEFFGHIKGAFSGADSYKKGLLQEADKGTIFLDEIGKMPSVLQVKLLKVIEEKKFKRLGESKDTEIDVHFISAVQQKDIDNIIPDLKYRLGYPDILKLSTLNERLNEIPLTSCQIVIESCLQTIFNEMNKGKIDVSVNFQCFGILKDYKYEGNYRELRNILRAAVRRAKENERNEIIPEDLYLLRDGLSQKEHSVESTVTYDNVKLKDIISYANQKRANIIEAKIQEVMNNGKDIKSVLKEEGLSESQYQMFTRNIKSITGKGLRDMKKHEKRFTQN